MNKESSQESFKKAFEILLNSKPSIISPVIDTVAQEFTFDDWRYNVYEEENLMFGGEARIILIISILKESIVEGKKEYDRDCIGILTLQLLPNNQTLFRIPPFKHWKSIMNDNFYQKVNESFYTQFLARLFSEFQKLGFIDFQEGKPPLGFRPSR